ncbi:anti-sigma factor domain-containing protein [Geodermatophilus sp. CPCC 205761]|uniref:anti-sigma factor domain-containing protein n=1 Tax=Geodermatophilus sp. CPCC 205761 TaxID=2936597 RepID=UPI003EED1DBE
MSELPGAPRRPDGHGTFDELAVGWALHALEPEEETLVAAHLPGCARCRGTVAETTEVMGALAADLPPARPSDRLGERLRAAVGETAQRVPAERPPGPRPAPEGDAVAWPADLPAVGLPGYPVPDPVEPPLPPTPWRRVLPSALLAGAVAAMLALGTWNVVLSTARDEARAAAAVQADVVNALLTPGRATIAPLSGDDGAPLATVVARAGRVQVVTHGLPVNEAAAQTYVIWGITGDTPVALGTFDVLRPQMDLRTVGSASIGLDDYSAYAVSLEPGRQAPSDPTDVVARGEVTS